MEANIIFDNVTAYDVVKFDVILGQTFKIELVEVPGILRWFTDNDQVLDVVVDDNGSSAIIKSTAKGDCEIQLQNQGAITKTLQVKVYDNVAVALNTSAKQPVLKG
jgi:hypothetical protein